MTTPTPDQIARAKTNLDNMEDWVDDFHLNGNDKIAEVYSKISETDDTDPAQTFLTNLLDAAFWSIGSVDFPGAGVISSFLGTFFGAYAGADMPPSLKDTFDGIRDRFVATCVLAKTDLVTIHDNVEKYWDRKYTNPVTGKEGYVSALGDGEVNMPAKHDKNDETAYNSMLNNAVAALKLGLTKATLGQAWYIQDDLRGTFQAGTEAELIQWIHKLMPDAQERMIVYQPDTGGTCCPIAGFHVYENILASGRFSSAPKELCEWLLIDDGYGNTLNPGALAMRNDVFNNWGLRHSYASADSTPVAPPKYTDGSLEADRLKGEQWRAFVTTNSRSAMEKQLVKRAQQDYGFLRNLVKEPKKTIEAFFGLPVPDAVDIEVLQEMPGTFKIVVPLLGALTGNAASAESALESQSA